jgi:hypothetical protein
VTHRVGAGLTLQPVEEMIALQLAQTTVRVYGEFVLMYGGQVGESMGVMMATMMMMMMMMIYSLVYDGHRSVWSGDYDGLDLPGIGELVLMYGGQVDVSMGGVGGRGGGRVIMIW